VGADSPPLLKLFINRLNCFQPGISCMPALNWS